MPSRNRCISPLDGRKSPFQPNQTQQNWSYCINSDKLRMSFPRRSHRCKVIVGDSMQMPEANHPQPGRAPGRTRKRTSATLSDDWWAGICLTLRSLKRCALAAINVGRWLVKAVEHVTCGSPSTQLLHPTNMVGEISRSLGDLSLALHQPVLFNLQSLLLTIILMICTRNCGQKQARVNPPRVGLLAHILLKLCPVQLLGSVLDVCSDRRESYIQRTIELRPESFVRERLVRVVA